MRDLDLQREITVKGAREHNLRDVNLTLPRGQLICFSGVSGSGKSSLAFDTLYAEGQRRYVESLSSTARQFLGQMAKPDVDLVTGLSPTISISQKSTGSNPRSTVGTITEIYDFLRVLYARVGRGYCPSCDTPIDAQPADAIVSRILELVQDDDPETGLLWILAPLARGQKGEFRDLFEDLRKQGFIRVRVDGKTYRLTDPPSLDRSKRHDVEVVVDRMEVEQCDRGRITEAVTIALRLGETTTMASLTEAGSEQAGAPKSDVLYSSRYACAACGISYRPPSPQLFSFNSPQGMCPTCEGIGRLYTFVPELLVSEPSKSIRKGAIGLLGKWGDLGRYRRHIYAGVAEAMDEVLGLEPGTMLTTAWNKLPDQAREVWLWGADESITFKWRGGRRAKKYVGSFDGLIPELLERYRTSRNKMQLRQFEKLMNTIDCPDCHGRRINPQASAVRITTRDASFERGELSLPEISDLPIDRLAAFFADLRLDGVDATIAAEALKEIRNRIGFLLGVGLDYLTLSRTAPTLSGGESQRIRLAGQIGSALSGVLYVLDEPSIGLHPRDNDRLIETLTRLRDVGNTLIVVEHDEDTMRASDLIVDFGPGPGVKGGHVVASGSVDTVQKTAKSVTGQFLSGERQIVAPESPRPIKQDQFVAVRGARHHNLKDIDVGLPLGVVTCVTGVSGSGKSSLIGGILQPVLRNALNGAELEPGDHDAVEGLDQLDKTIAIDQTPIGRTPRSNPATYVKVFDEIRKLYAQLPEAKARGYNVGRFSFNVDGGRCAACDGNGATKLEMDFLADIWVTCAVCQGHRYNRETLAVKFKNKSIADVLEMDISESLELFQNVPRIAEKLQTLVDVGLEYLKLGQPSPTLSGGEAQRIKLTKELSRRDTGKTLYILDEPTTGLHFADIELLLEVIKRLADRGNTVVIVEHNLDVIKTADWIIDMGLEGGEGGGRVVAEGRPNEVAKVAKSYTGAALAKAMGIKRRGKPPAKAMRHVPTLDVAARTHVLVEGAREHNLKSVDVTLPRDAMTVFCGPSGSGKSSLAMSTIYAEGQRRYVESLSSYARQFIGQVQKPKADRIEGLSPAVALEQKNLSHSPRSTVGTVTEVYDYLRILFSKLGTMHCPRCGDPIGTQTPQQIADKVASMPEGTRLLILAPIEVVPGEASKQTWQTLRSSGLSRVRINGKTVALEDAKALDPRRTHDVEVVVDRVRIDSGDPSRIADSVEQALSLGSGNLRLAIASDQPESKWKVIAHSQHLVCGSCGRSFEPLTPHHFSFNSSLGWCSACEGLGTQTGTNPAALLGTPTQALLDGAALLWPSVNQSVSRWMLRALSRATSLRIDVPISELDASELRVLFHGCGDEWIAVNPSDTRDGEQRESIDDQSSHSNQWVIRDGETALFRYQFKGFYPALDEAARLVPGLRGKLEQFVAEIDCSACVGSRLRDDSSATRFRERTISDLVHMPLDRLDGEIRSWKLTRREKKVAGEVIHEIASRVAFLRDVGLDYLTLHRGASTLSGGESQRIRLASQLGSGLCGVLYVLDEPTIGLHPSDNQRLLGALHRLRDLGNTLLVVEHDHDVIAGSDHLCDFGPAAGRHGGRIVAEGTRDALSDQVASNTAPYLDGSASIPIPDVRRPVISKTGDPMVEMLSVSGARENNLADIDVQIPLGVMTAVTGPSGSGKSTLINEIVFPALARRLHRARVRPGRHEKIDGLRFVDKVIRVDQSPLGNSPSSNPATYTGVFDLIRNLFANVPEAKERRFTPRTFSFNVSGGRCETCEGTGQRKIEMHFLPDVWVQCEECSGRRYNDDVLEVRYHGCNIADVLEMPCGEASLLFTDYPRILRVVETLCDVGLDYITLGQPAPTLSGGEAQRVKLAAELARPATGHTVYVLDEPTTGLHFSDIERLLQVMQKLVELGNSVVVIEHNLDVIKAADWILDLGPGAGRHGGQLVFAGTPEGLAATAGKKHASLTASFLKDAISRSSSSAVSRKTPQSGSTTNQTAPAKHKPPKKPSKQTEPTSTATTSACSEVLANPPSSDEPDGNHSSETVVKLPWQALGRRWHTLPKGFAGDGPDWPLELVDDVLNLLEEIAGEAAIKFPSEDRVAIRLEPDKSAQVPQWAELRTKLNASLLLCVSGPKEAIDVDQLLALGEVQSSEESSVRIDETDQATLTLHLRKREQARDRTLKKFLTQHLEAARRIT
ncbi:MAG: excinuclease ABC subunit UvrA [Planctomycetota bacterium]